jgi:hypothetical protein
MESRGNGMGSGPRDPFLLFMSPITCSHIGAPDWTGDSLTAPSQFYLPTFVLAGYNCKRSKSVGVVPKFVFVFGIIFYFINDVPLKKKIKLNF